MSHIINKDQFSSFEVLAFDISVAQSARVFVVYRPPPSGKNGLTFKLFLSEFANFQGQHITCTKQLVVLRDFNVYINT